MSTAVQASPAPAVAARVPAVDGLALLLVVVHVVNDACTSTLPALLPMLGERLRLTGGALSTLIAAFFLSASLPQPLFGALADRIGGRAVATVGLLTTTLLVLLLGHVSTFAGLLIVSVVSGLGSAAVHPAVVGLVRVVGGRHPGTVMALFGAGGMLGAALGPLIVPVLTLRTGPAGMGWLAPLGLATAALLARRAPRGESPARPSHAMPVTTSVVAVLTRGPIPVLLLVSSLSTLAFLTFTSIMPLHIAALDGRGARSPVIGWTLAAFAVSAAAGGLIAEWCARRIGRDRLVGSTLLLSGAALQGVLLTRPGSALFYLLVMASGALLFAHTPLLLVTAQAHARGAEGIASGVMLGLTSALGASGLALLGRYQDALGVVVTSTMAFAATVPAAWLGWWILRRRRREEAPTPPHLVTTTAPACACSDACAALVAIGGAARRLV